MALNGLEEQLEKKKDIHILKRGFCNEKAFTAHA
jgi:hypothetical protein